MFCHLDQKLRMKEMSQTWKIFWESDSKKVAFWLSLVDFSETALPSVWFQIKPRTYFQNLVNLFTNCLLF